MAHFSEDRMEELRQDAIEELMADRAEYEAEMEGWLDDQEARREWEMAVSGR